MSHQIEPTQPFGIRAASRRSIRRIYGAIEALRQQFSSLLHRVSAPGVEVASEQTDAATTADLAAAAGAIPRV